MPKNTEPEPVPDETPKPRRRRMTLRAGINAEHDFAIVDGINRRDRITRLTVRDGNVTVEEL